MEPGGGGELQVGGGGGWVEGLSVIMKLTSHFNDEAARLSLCVNRRDRMGEQHNYTRVIRGGREGRGEGGGAGGWVGAIFLSFLIDLLQVGQVMLLACNELFVTIG